MAFHAKFHPHRCNVSPLRGEKPQNRPLSKLNTGRLALCAMLPVIMAKGHKNSSGVEIANVNFFYDDSLQSLTRTSKYSPLLNIQHDAGYRQWRREWAWPRVITVRRIRRFSHAPICCNEVRFEVTLPEYHLTTGEFLTLTPSLGVIHCEYRHK